MTNDGSAEPVFKLDGVSKRFALRGGERHALKDVSLSGCASEWTALLGPNGSGKSTLLKLLAGLAAPSEGRVLAHGAEPTSRASRAKLGVVFQAAALDKLLTVRENLATQAALCGLTRARAHRVVEERAAELGITDRLDERVKTLSGGLERRADLARAALNDPALLLLDEPTAGLDPESRAAFLDAVRSLTDRGACVVMSTHLMDEAQRADRVVMMADGEVAAHGAPDELRGDLGERMIRCRAEEESALTGAGLRVRVAGDEAIGVSANGDSSALARAGEDLLARGVPFSAGPPTLADAYLARTGKDLAREAQP